MNILQKNLHPVYDSDRRQGYEVWNRDKLWKYQKQKLRLFVFPKAWIFIQKIVCIGLITIISFAEKEITKLIGGKNLCHEE